MIKLQTGTSGWVDKHWIGIFYPPDCNSNQQLSFYAQRFITKDPDEPLSRLMERASGLQEKLGLILFQFPQTWHINIERLQPFLELLQTYPQQQFTV
ncbi:DUF72 domain-containing protein [Chroogloeocystis siderophila]|uniref:DUF72 domain-containing protein n=1 Tax=Chroogloeocystis siderophila TaxID=329163 RepID=UPI000A74E4AF|nr:DUF72 domain-containing protein [Chroogloeocystis siderophila]